MGKNRVLMFVLTILLGMTPLAGQAADELFDTKAAAQHNEKGIALLKAKNYDGAIGEFEQAAEISPDADAYYYLGYAYYLKGRTGDGENRKRSIENFEKAYEIDPNFTPSRYTPPQPAPAEAPQPAPGAGGPAAQSPASAPQTEQPKQ